MLQVKAELDLFDQKIISLNYFEKCLFLSKKREAVGITRAHLQVHSEGTLPSFVSFLFEGINKCL